MLRLASNIISQDQKVKRASLLKVVLSHKVSQKQKLRFGKYRTVENGISNKLLIG